MLKWLTQFFTKDRYSGKDIDLIVDRVFVDGLRSTYTVMKFYIVLHKHYFPIGKCDLRLENNEELYYAGNIGYRIYPQFRGHHYAYQACQLLIAIAKDKELKDLYITCSPENIASEKTIQRIGLQYIETTNVPIWHWLYGMEERVKKIYWMKL